MMGVCWLCNSLGWASRWGSRAVRSGAGGHAVMGSGASCLCVVAWFLHHCWCGQARSSSRFCEAAVVSGCLFRLASFLELSGPRGPLPSSIAFLSLRIGSQISDSKRLLVVPPDGRICTTRWTDKSSDPVHATRQQVISPNS